MKKRLNNLKLSFLIFLISLSSCENKSTRQKSIEKIENEVFDKFDEKVKIKVRYKKSLKELEIRLSSKEIDSQKDGAALEYVYYRLKDDNLIFDKYTVLHKNEKQSLLQSEFKILKKKRKKYDFYLKKMINSDFRFVYESINPTIKSQINFDSFVSSMDKIANKKFAFYGQMIFEQNGEKFIFFKSVTSDVSIVIALSMKKNDWMIYGMQKENGIVQINEPI